MFGDEQKRYVPVRSKPYMGSGPEVEEDEEQAAHAAFCRQIAFHADEVIRLTAENAELTAKLQQVNLAFAAHLARCNPDEGEPEE